MAAEKKPASGWLNLLVDYGPLLVFFAVYWFYAPEDKEDGLGTIFAVVRSTGAFMLAAVVALVVAIIHASRTSGSAFAFSSRSLSATIAAIVPGAFGVFVFAPTERNTRSSRSTCPSVSNR